MRISDPRWPAVRELARIILRTEELVVTGPEWLESHILNLGLRLADVQPARTTFPAFVSNTEGEIQLVDPASSEIGTVFA